MDNCAEKIFFTPPGRILFLSALFFIGISALNAQPALPPRSLTVTATQGLHFGTFALSGSTGSVTVGWDGSRSATGNIVLLSIFPTPQPAIFEIKLCQGRNVIITFSNSTILTGNQGGSLQLDIGPTDQGGNNAIFAAGNDCNFITPLRVGGTLHIPLNALPGTYTGSFEITFHQE